MNMNTATALAVEPAHTLTVTSTPAPLVALIPVTDAQVADFCDAILLGLPTNKILPASISDLKATGGITSDQLDQIKAARKEHEANAEADRKVLFRLARTRCVRGARFNREGKLIGLRLGDRITNRNS